MSHHRIHVSLGYLKIVAILYEGLIYSVSGVVTCLIISFLQSDDTAQHYFVDCTYGSGIVTTGR
jgi:hypothetical protein